MQPADFNSYGARRGNHEVMMRGTFANIRIRNRITAGHRRRRDQALPLGRGDVDLRRGHALPGRGPPLVVFAGKEYGTGSSRDWAAKGTKLLGVRAVIAESFERIHRSNLVGMGVLPLQFQARSAGTSSASTGEEMSPSAASPRPCGRAWSWTVITARRTGRRTFRSSAGSIRRRARLLQQWRHPAYVLRQLAA